MEVICALEGVSPPAAQFVVGKDVNIDLEDPRSPDKERAGHALTGLLERWGASIVGDGQPTHRDRHGARRLDILVVGRQAAGGWDTTRRWHPGLSDHAVLVGRRRADGAPRARACAPANLARLPAEAWADLRRVHASIGVTLGVPDPGLVVPRHVPYNKPEEGFFPPGTLRTGSVGTRERIRAIRAAASIPAAWSRRFPHAPWSLPMVGHTSTRAWSLVVQVEALEWRPAGAC